MEFRNNRALRVISTIVLVLFIWTFCGIFEIVHALQNNPNSSISAQQSREPKPEERFEKAIKDVEDITEKLKKVQTHEEREAEKEGLRQKRQEIEGHDAEIRKQFAETEEKIKGLPDEIKQRHKDFIKKYEENLNTLKRNLDEIEKAETAEEVKVEVEKVKTFFEKVRPPSRHTPLDPNKLPHRKAEPTKKKPRLKYDNQESGVQSYEFASPITHHASPVLVASIGDLQGILTNATTQALAPPTQADLSETIEIQFTQEIRDLSNQLQNNPVKIYEWVRNNIEYVPTYGSIQGANMCLQTKQCNAFDTASLLIALLRTSNIPAKYVYGTIEIPIDKVMNWVGGFTDANSALNLIASGGIPVNGLISGGKLSAAQMEHVWVEAWVDYIPSRGAIHKQGDTWIPLDASYKHHTYTEGVDFQTVVPFDGQGFTAQAKASATINEQESYFTNISSSLVQTTLSDYATRIENYVNQNIPNATAGDIIGKKEIIKKEQPILPASLPYKIIITGVKTSEISDQLRHKISIQLIDASFFTTVFSYTASLPQLSGKRATVSYDPATTADQNLINKYLEQYATEIPAYLIQLKPVLKIENTIVASGAAIGMGNLQDLTIHLISPKSTEIVTHNMIAGDYTAIGLNPSKISLESLQSRINKNDFSEPVGEMLYQTALSYWAEVDAFNNAISRTLRVTTLRHPSELAASAKISISYLYGIPHSATYKSRSLDVKLDTHSIMSKSGDKAKEIFYMQQSGITGSFLEGAIFDQLFGRNIGNGISAITALKIANDQGIAIYKIDSGNIGVIVPKLQVSELVKSEVYNAVNAGLTVYIPQTNIIHAGWTGVAYIIINPTDGSGAYMISGGINGGSSNTNMITIVPLPQVPLIGIVGMVVSALASSVGTLITDTAGRLIGIAITASELIAAGMVIILIIAFLSDLIKRFEPPPNWQTFRHYTDYGGLAGILNWNYIKASDYGDLGPGAYVTDLFMDPRVPGNAEYIAATLRMDISKVQTYVDVEIDRNRIILLSDLAHFPHQYIYFLFPIPLNGIDAKRVGQGPAGP
jgi:transglutaminase-like putative cysteine protease